MNREVHVRFWEGLAVRFRWATQLSQSRISVRALVEQIQLITRKGLNVIGDDVVK